MNEERKSVLIENWGNNISLQKMLSRAYSYKLKCAEKYE